MKKISRLTALLLALLVFSSAALATEEPIPLEELDSESYAQLLAAAEDANAAVGKTAVVNQDGVYVFLGNSWSEPIAKGTEVTITSVGSFLGSWYGVSYVENGETKTGYIQTKYLDVQEPAPEITYTPWDGKAETVALSVSVDGAASYEWQRSLCTADGEPAWETIPDATAAELAVPATSANLKYAYRCVVMLADGTQVTSEEITLVDADRAQWLASAEAEISPELLQLAVQASSLDSMMLVGDRLIHVRTGETFATYDEATHTLTDVALNVAFARVENGVLTPVSQAAETVE